MRHLKRRRYVGLYTEHFFEFGKHKPLKINTLQNSFHSPGVAWFPNRKKNLKVKLNAEKKNVANRIYYTEHMVNSNLLQKSP